MNQSQPYDDEFLTRYIDGELSSAEREAFERSLATDIALQERVDRLRLSVNAVRYYGRAEKVRSIHHEMMQELQTPTTKLILMKPWTRYVAIAAAILVLALGAWFFTKNNISADRLYEEAYVDYKASGTRGEAGSSPIRQAYASADYAAVLRQSTQAGTAEDSLLVSLSYLKQKQEAAAIPWLTKLQSDDKIGADAEFYLSLALLKTAHYKESLGLMKKIATDEKHPYHQQFPPAYLKKAAKMSDE